MIASPAVEAEMADFATICHASRGKKEYFGFGFGSSNQSFFVSHPAFAKATDGQVGETWKR